MIFDATECPIEKPTDWAIQNQFYSGKKKKHTIKYEIGVQFKTGRFIWISDGTPGKYHDLTLACNSGIIDHLLPDEKIMADKGYFVDFHFVTPFKSPMTEFEIEWNSYLSTVRQIVEHAIGRLKIFGCLKQTFRHHLKLHPIMFKVIAEIVNRDLVFRPLKK